MTRVHYGLLPEAMKNSNDTPQARRLLAVPFVGKDVPSHAAEFSHPDALIGLTVLAYRHEGLRKSDFRGLLNLLLEAMEQEGGPYRERPTCRLYARWVRLAGGRVRGTRRPERNTPTAELLAATVQPTAGAEQARFTPPPANGSPGGAANSPRGGEYDDLWPLQLVNPQDDEQLGVLYALLHRLPAVQHYLEQLVFPLTMQHQLLKLSANGQDLGSKALFGCRLGFSGTPSDLLPKDFGRAQYQRGDDAMMIATLTNPAVVQYTFTSEQWTVGGLLDEVAAARPPYHTLIDAGALITGLTNLQVARYLLQHGLPSMDGVVFLDEADRKMILLRAGLKVLPLAGCGVRRRWCSFFAVASASTSSVAVGARRRSAGHDLPRLAQGAFGAPSARQAITPARRRCGLVRVEVARLQRQPPRAKGLRDASHEQALKVVCAWLLVNLMRTEDVQAGLLAEQRLAHVFRQRALEHLLAHHRRCGAARTRPRAARAIDLHGADGHHVAADVPSRRAAKALDMAARHEGFLRASIPGTDGAASERRCTRCDRCATSCSASTAAASRRPSSSRGSRRRRRSSSRSSRCRSGGGGGGRGGAGTGAGAGAGEEPGAGGRGDRSPRATRGRARTRGRGRCRSTCCAPRRSPPARARPAAASAARRRRPSTRGRSSPCTARA